MPLPKVIVQLYPMIPAGGEEGRKAKRPVGADNEAYHRIIHEWTEIVQEADAMGVWGLSTIEHHLHSEGYEVGPNPGVLNAYWAAHVKNARVGALGYVAATQDPIRIAEGEADPALPGVDAQNSAGGGDGQSREHHSTDYGNAIRRLSSETGEGVCLSMDP